MKRFKKMLPVVLLFISLNTLNTYAADAGHSDLSFEEYAYEHMEIDALDETITKIKDALVISGEEETVDKLITEMEDYNNALNQNIAIAYIYSDLDAADPYWDGEVSYNDALFAESNDRIYAAYHEIAVSPYADVLKKRIDTNDWEDILQYTPLTDKQKGLLKEENRLMLLYDTLCVKEYRTKEPMYGMYAMTEEELLDAYKDKNISIEQYHEGYADIYTQKNSEWGEVFIELADIRTQIARSFGYDNYAEYAYKEIYGREYTPDDLTAFREDVKKYLVPLKDELYQMLYVDHAKEYQRLYREDISTDECLAVLERYCISEDMSESYRYMTDHHLYDISDDSKKTPGAYTIAIPGYNAPFLYHKSNGNILDMETLIHEFGHFNQLYHMDADSWYYNRKNTDLAEVHSQGLELLFLTYADEIYGKDADVMKLYILYDLVNSCIEGVKEDDFQCRVYDYVSGDNAFTVSAANHLYGEVCSEYGGKVCCDDHYFGGLIPDGRDLSWIGIGHTFKAPMYYISYAVSAAAVFELFDKNDDRIQTYNELVKLGFTKSFSKTMETAGLNDPLVTPRFEEYAKDIRGYIYPIQVRDQIKNKIPLMAFALAVIIILAIQHKKSKKS